MKGSTTIKPFYTAEIESLIETFAENNPNVVILPKADMTDAQNNLLSQEQFVKKLKDLIKTMYSSKKITPNTKFIVLLDCGASIAPDQISINYAESDITTSIGGTRNSTELGLLCFSKGENDQIKYCYTAPANFIHKNWLDEAFNDAGINSVVAKIVTIPSNKLESGIMICYQAKQFIETNLAQEEKSKEEETDLKKLAQEYQQTLESNFYGTRSFTTTLKSNLNFFSPMALGFMLFSGSRFAESWMVMSRDESLLEGSTLPVQIMRVIILLSVRPLEAITMLGATAFGAKKYSEIGSLFRTGYISALISSAIFIPILCTSEYWLKSWCGVEEKLAKAAGDYLTRYAWAMPALTTSVAENNIFFATNNQEVPFLTELFTVFLGVGITNVLVNGKLGFQPQGLTGFATSLVIQKWLNFFINKAVFYYQRNRRKYIILDRQPWADTWVKTKLIFRKGIPLAFQIGAEQLYLFIVAIYAQAYGKMHNTKALDQANILNEYFFLFPLALGLVAHKTALQRGAEVRGRDQMLREKGANLEIIQKNLATVPHIIKSNMIIALVCSAIIVTLFCTCSDQLVNGYINSNNFTPEDAIKIKEGISSIFKILAACTLPEMIGNVMGGGLNGLGDVDSPMLRSIFLTAAVGGVLGYVLCFSANLSLEGEYLSSLIAYSIGMLALAETLYSTYGHLKNTTAVSTESVYKNIYTKVRSCCFCFFNKDNASLEQKEEKTTLLSTASSRNSNYGIGV